MNTLDRILQLWPQTPLSGPNPREIPDVGRDDLAVLFANLDFHYGAEIGTEHGFYAEQLCRANPELRLDCVDPYYAYSAYRDHKSQDKLDRFYAEATARLQPYNAVFVRDFSSVAVHGYRDNVLDFVYLDGNHALPYVVQDLCDWSPKVRKGGIIAGHDFIRRNNSLRYQCHVVEAVHAYTQCYMVNEWYVLGTKDEIPGQKRDIIRSFMWVKG